MTRARLFALSLAAVMIVFALVWPFRARYLFSWDSANYAFAMSRIDIARHRPHPPGYLGYVFAGRVLRAATADPNAALILWNVVALAGAAVFTAGLAASMGLEPPGVWAAAILIVTSPLIWFYASVAEIYVSELLWAAAIGYAAHAALGGSRRALYWCAGSLAGAAIFKASTMVLMLPVAGYAWYRAPSGRTRAALLLACSIAAVAGMFLTIAPDLPRFAWQQFTAATASSRLVSGTSNPAGLAIAFNRNLRDTTTAAIAALGIVNTVGLFAWLITSRRLPPLADWRFASWWALPWMAVFLLVLIAKPGYVLPLMPLASVLLAGFYSRGGRATLAALTTAQAIANIVYITCLMPPAADPRAARYRDKTVLQRIASDIAPLTFPTRATLRTSDRHIADLQSVAASCAETDWVLVTGAGTVDWRRAMYYVPSARAVYLVDGRPTFIGIDGDFAAASDSGTTLTSSCGLLWLLDERPPAALGPGARRVNDLGWMMPAGSGRVTRESISWNR